MEHLFYIFGCCCSSSFVELTPRQLQRILLQASKAKLVLSANKKTDFFLEGFHEDRDLRIPVTRDELEGKSGENESAGHCI